MLFTLEAVYAKHGDALILHYGQADNPRWILIDGGPGGVYASLLRPRLDKLRADWEFESPASLPLELVMVSHIDDDHIAGILDLFEDVISAHDRHQPLPFTVKRLWHNSFDDLVGHSDDRLATALTESPHDGDETAVVASVPQGRRLRQAIEKLATGALNPGFHGLVLAQDADDDAIDLEEGLRLRVICPTPKRLNAFQLKWQQELPAILRKEKKAAEVAAMDDSSPFNLSSIVVLAEMAGRTMLLTGDARGDDIIAGLEATQLLRDTEPLRIDLLKIPHHGSSRNVDEGFFRRVIANHYVFSGDGSNGNPEPATLAMLAAARGTDEYTLHFTEHKNSLGDLTDWLRDECPASCHVAFRGTDPASSSIHVDLGDSPL